MSAFHAYLPHETLLSVAGQDSATFLQGQLTCDVNEVDEQTARLGAYCNPQGRMVCDFLLSRSNGEHYQLRLRSGIAEQALATLGKYIVFSKAEIAAATDALVAGVWGEGAHEALAQALGGAPDDALGCWQGDGVKVIRLPGSTPAFECHIDSAASEATRKAIEAVTASGNIAEWEALQHSAGLGRIEAANIEEFIPQMLNYDLTGHVSFTKGCYTGQEVVARMHYRGKPKRRMYRASVADSPDGGDSQKSAAAGEALFAASSTQSVGNIVNEARLDNGQSLLVVATADGVAAGLHLGSIDGPALQLQALPYALSDEES